MPSSTSGTNPALRDIFEHTDVHDNTVLIDRRTRWGNMFRIGP